MEGRRKTPRTTAHSHSSRNLPSNAAWVARRPSPLQATSHPTKPEPQHRSHSTSRPRCLRGQHSMESSWQADRAGGYRGAARHFPGMAEQPQPAQVSKTDGLSWPHQHILLQVHFSSCPPPGQMGRRAPTRAHFSRQCDAKYRTAEEPAGPRLVVGCRRKTSSYVQLLFDAYRLGNMEMRAGLWGCEEERAMSHMKSICWSWRDAPTSVQAR